MKTQKNFQDDFRRQTGYRLKVVDEFPAYYTYGGQLGIKSSNRSSTGIWFEYTSTGGRLSYQDYSGQAQLDQLLKASQIGLFHQLKINEARRWHLFLALHGSVIFSKLALESTYKIGTFSDNETLHYQSVSVALRPGLLLQRNLGNFVVQAGLGAEIQTWSGLHFDKDKDNILKTSDGKEVNAQWAGARLHFGVGFLLTRRKNAQD